MLLASLEGCAVITYLNSNHDVWSNSLCDADYAQLALHPWLITKVRNRFSDVVFSLAIRRGISSSGRKERMAARGAELPG